MIKCGFISVLNVAGKFRPKMSRHGPGEVPGSAMGLKIFLKLYFYVKCQSLKSFRCSRAWRVIHRFCLSRGFVIEIKGGFWCYG